QVATVQNPMSADATIFRVACMSMAKNGTTQVLQKVLSKGGGTYVGFKSYCMADGSFPRQIGQDETYPAALRIKEGATAARLPALLTRAGQPVAEDAKYYRDKRFPGETDPIFRANAGASDPWAFPEPIKVKRPSIDELIGKPIVIPARRN